MDRLLQADRTITHVALIHCETSTGILNPLAEIAQVVKTHGKRLIIDGAHSHHCVPLQGSGTFAVEAAIGTLVPRNGKVLVLINGAYGKRLAKICEVLGRDFSTFETAEDEPTRAALCIAVID